MLRETWSGPEAAARLATCGETTIVVEDGRAYLLKVNAEANYVECREIDALRSSQEETDSRVILYIEYAESQGFPFVVVLQTQTSSLLH